MAEIRTVTTLKSKRSEIIASIANYERRLAQARADLSHVNATIAMFEAKGHHGEMQPYVDLHRLFKRGEQMTLCKAMLADGPKNTRELAQHVMASKGLDTGDKVLARSIALQLVHALRMQWKRGLIVSIEKERGARVWRLPQSSMPFQTKLV